MNNLVLKGRLGQDPKLIPVGESKKVVFSMAVSRSFKKKDGEWGDEVTWVPCEAWDSGAERIHQQFSKGDPILIEGSLKEDQWEKDGEKRSKLFVRIRKFYRLKFDDNKSDNSDTQGEQTPVASASGENIPF